MNATVILARNEERDQKAAAELMEYLRFRGIPTVLLQDGMTEHSDEYYNTDILFVLGGDGSIMHVAERAARFGSLILGVNYGHLGYLAEMDRMDFLLIDRVISGDYTVEERMMLQVELNGEQATALNDLVVSKNGVAGVVELEVLCDGRSVGNYRCDGMIVATPTGSTAYSLSAGGSVVDPALECMCLTPVCAHSFTARPLIFSSKSELRIQNTDRLGRSMLCALDGSRERVLEAGQTLTVKKSPLCARFVRLINKGFYDTLRAKMMNGR
ncbi:MAG: NAD(+)/NADH kinase [Clostridia bacterium]|nr:NAD(+)/NADH kinase [Clostridia bacterium]